MIATELAGSMIASAALLNGREVTKRSLRFGRALRNAVQNPNHACATGAKLRRCSGVGPNVLSAS